MCASPWVVSCIYDTVTFSTLDLYQKSQMGTPQSSYFLPFLLFFLLLLLFFNLKYFEKKQAIF